MSYRGWLVVASSVLAAGLLTWLAAPGELAQPAQPPTTKGPGGMPMTGKIADVLAPIDAVMEKILLRHGVPGAAVAITKDGRLVFARGYGWAHYEAGTLATPQTLFGLASVSKCFTTLAVLKLVEDGKLKLDDKAFDFFKDVQPPPRATVDPRLARVTIRQLLNHSGGWDRTKNGDPINWSFQVAQRLGVQMPIGEEHLTRFMLGVPLDFDPGSRQEYSNFGYILLGQIVARVSGQPYEQFVRLRVLQPMGVQAARMHDREGKYFPGEARRYNPGHLQAMAPYNAPWTDSSGGWAASAVDLARFMSALDGSRAPFAQRPAVRADLYKEMVAAPAEPLKARPDGTYYGLGWDTIAATPQGPGYMKGGTWPGVRAMVKHRIDGVNTVILCNALAHPDQLDMKIASEALQELQAHLAEITDWSKVDLFDEFR